ncbi:MAG: histidine kinase [Gemmatimonadaceae bacterium]|nr:histidine kinase [Gemmatimonadaceae bacterium]
MSPELSLDAAPTADAPPRAGVAWRPLLVASLVLAALATAASAVAYAARGDDSPASFVAFQFVSWLWWVLVAPVVRIAVRRAPLATMRRSRRALLRVVGVHLATATALALLHAVTMALVMIAVSTRASSAGWAMLAGSYLIAQWPYELLGYVAVAGAWHAASLAGVLREREASAARLEAQLATAQLSALTMQLQPHFLFNTLQGIATLVEDDPGAARALLHRLAALLRTLLDAGATPEVPLEHELAIVTEYLAIERTRFPDRLVVRSTVDDAVREALVPVLLLQPIVENAIRHAVAPRVAPTTIAIEARRDGDGLVITVTDDGAGFAPGEVTPLHLLAVGREAVRGARRRGLGLANTRARLAQRHGERARLTIDSTLGRGTRVTLRLPLTPAP